MNNGLALLNKLYLYIGLAGFSGCYLSFFLSLNVDLKSALRLEAVSTFLLGTAFAGLLFSRPLPNFMYLNIFISLSCGIVSSFLSSHFLRIDTKENF